MFWYAAPTTLIPVPVWNVPVSERPAVRIVVPGSIGGATSKPPIPVPAQVKAPVVSATPSVRPPPVPPVPGISVLCSCQYNRAGGQEARCQDEYCSLKHRRYLRCQQTYTNNCLGLTDA